MAEIGNTSVFSQTDANNNSGTVPTWPENMAPSQVNDSGRAFQGAVTREWNWRNATLTSTGSANAYVLTYSVAPAAYYNGQIFAFKTNFTNSGTATINVNALGAKAVKKVVAGSQTDLVSGDWPSGEFVEVAYNTTANAFIWLNRGSPETVSFSSVTLSGTGLYSPGATGGDKGANTANFNDYYVGGVRMEQIVRKTANETINSDTSLGPDAELTFVTSSGDDYQFEFQVWISTVAAADFRWDLDSTGGAPTTLHYAYDSISADGTARVSGNSAVINTAHDITQTSGVLQHLIIRGIIYGATAGAVRIRWRQLTSDVGNTTVRKGSFVKYVKL